MGDGKNPAEDRDTSGMTWGKKKGIFGLIGKRGGGKEKTPEEKEGA